MKSDSVNQRSTARSSILAACLPACLQQGLLLKGSLTQQGQQKQKSQRHVTSSRHTPPRRRILSAMTGSSRADNMSSGGGGAFAPLTGSFLIFDSATFRFSRAWWMSHFVWMSGRLFAATPWHGDTAACRTQPLMRGGFLKNLC